MREMCVSKSIGLALKFEGNLPFLLCFTLHLRAISKDKPPGAGGIYLEGRFNGGFFALQVWGAYTWRGLFSECYGIYYISEVNLARGKGTCTFSGPYSRIRPAKLTNHSACTN